MPAPIITSPAEYRAAHLEYLPLWDAYISQGEYRMGTATYTRYIDLERAMGDYDFDHPENVGIDYNTLPEQMTVVVG